MAAEERAAFLDEQCGEDRELIQHVEGMVAFEKRRPEFLAGSAAQAMFGTGSDELPTSIGPFRILSKLGQGGMGAVYEAQQESPHRTVALKVLQPFLSGHDAIRRFEHEGDFLARLQHPGIAQIFDSGRADTEHGSMPYFALELVRGDPLTVHARKHQLSTRERLELLAQVADAVQHAHQHGVIHRDLKPANILVNESGQPKVLDFGIARASNSDIQLTTLQTDVGKILGTLAYMSPEQTRGDPALIDTRSDVYSLGVLLYELLTDRLPYDVSDKSLPEAVRIIQEEAPSRMRAVDSAHRGDLETIVRSALEKDKERRYASAEALAADIRRFLRHEPIAARPPSRMYTLSMLVRRNKTLAGSVCAGFLVLVAGLIVSLVLKARAEHRTDEVLRLAAIQRLEDLTSEAEQLWPPHGEFIEDYGTWIASAAALVSELPLHRAKRAELRALARQSTPEESKRDREGHAQYPRIVEKGEELAQRRVALARRLGDEPVVTDEGLVPSGMEGAEALSQQADRLFAAGRDDEAMEMADAAYATAYGNEREAIEKFVESLADRITAATSPAGLGEAKLEIATLDNELLALEALVEEQRTWRFPEEQEVARWWHNQLTKLIRGLESLDNQETGLLGQDAISPEYGWSVPKRLALAQELGRSQHETSWKKVLPEIAKAYPGLDLTIQMGLVPIGKDQVSGKWEFWHVASGDRPEWGANGQLQVTDEMGLVMVLLPGGTFDMGATPMQDKKNYDPAADWATLPVHAVELSAFFLSKYEMTQAQWRRGTGEIPSRWPPQVSSYGWTPRHPVETVSWDQCNLVLGRMGLSLPSEAQWEYGCRAGTDTPFSCPTGELASHANLSDQAYAYAFQTTIIGEQWNDGFGGPSPVGSFSPNGFGLHDVHGNLWEWCLDGFHETFYANSPLVDPVAPGRGVVYRVFRGGTFGAAATFARSATRSAGTPLGAYDNLGVRPARAIDP